MEARNTSASISTACASNCRAPAGYWSVDHRSRRGDEDEQHCYSRSWRIALLERFWQARHPPRYAAYLTPSSPSFRLSSTFEAKITVEVEVAHGFYGDNNDVAGDMAKLPLDTLFKQSSLSPIQAEQLAGGVRFRVSAETAYHVRAYDIDGWEFQFCAVGHDNLIPAMPPILDHILGDL